MLNKDKINKICSDNLPKFKNVIQGMSFEGKGILNSEMLLFISLVNYFGVKLIIESGRARGQSTKIIAEFFKKPKYKIYSVEFNKYSRDVRISFEKLKKYKNLILLFGNSFDIIPGLIIEECCILIDGPKDEASIKLAIKLLKNPLVKAVFIHDLYKDNPHRAAAEKIFINYFYTDDKNFVKKNKSLDKQCWLDQRKFKESRSWEPYRRGKKIMKSYSATLLAILNSDNPIVLEQLTAYLENIKKSKNEWSFKDLLEGWVKDLKTFVQFPFLYIYYEKIVDRKRQLVYYDFIRQWLKILYFSIRSSIIKLINILKF